MFIKFKDIGEHNDNSLTMLELSIIQRAKEPAAWPMGIKTNFLKS